MLLHDRHGIIGFMLTVALGVAIGAATLVVGTEVARNVKDKLTKNGKQTQPAASQGKSALSDPVVAKAWDSYQKAKKAYDAAIAAASADAQQLKAEMERLRDTWKKAVLERTGRNGTSGQTAGGQQNPFTGGKVQVDSTNSTTGKAELLPTVNKPSTGSPTTGGSSDQVSLKYYTVKEGDSLSAICQRYYGDKGMWTHILNYQIPSIAATPNLIFPGQIIALPRNLNTSPTSSSSSSTSTSSSLTTNSSSNSSPSTAGNHPVAPAGDESWDDTFQKDFVISDHVLTNTNTMTVAQIQSFLDAKGSCLAKPYNGSTPAQMIYNAAKKYGINPQVLLTRLQCEQGLITQKSATQKELDWALGVGCYDSGNWNTKFKGFDKQIEGAAQTYRRHYDDARAKLDKGEKVTMTIDGQSVTMKSAASYAFYKYCPHFQGNKLFFDVWRGYKKNWP